MITTDRLELAPVALSDHVDTLTMMEHPDTARFLRGYGDAEGVWNKLLRNIGHWTAFGYGMFTVRERASGDFVGQVGIGHFARGLGPDFDPYPEASWILDPRMQGRGYALESAVAAHSWFLENQGPVRLVCIIHPANEPSLHLAAKLGYHAYGIAEYHDEAPVKLERQPL